MHISTHLSLALLLLTLTACVPVQEEETVLQEEQSEVIGEEQPDDNELVIVERLLPSGLLEIGDRDAPTSLMMFTEHHCRYCKQFFREQFPRLHEDFIAQGKLRLQIGILPLKKYIHSERAALGLLCASTQGKGIPMHEILFKIGAKDRATLMKEAVTLELDLKLFEQCLDSPDTARTIERQRSLARTLDVELVPTFYLNGEKSVGLPYYADLRGMIESQIQK